MGKKANVEPKNCLPTYISQYLLIKKHAIFFVSKTASLVTQHNIMALSKKLDSIVFQV